MYNIAIMCHRVGACKKRDAGAPSWRFRCRGCGVQPQHLHFMTLAHDSDGQQPFSKPVCPWGSLSHSLLTRVTDARELEEVRGT